MLSHVSCGEDMDFVTEVDNMIDIVYEDESDEEN